MKRTSQELLEFFGLDKGTIYEEGIHRGIDEGYFFLKMNNMEFDVRLESVECSGSELGVDVRLNVSMFGTMKLKPRLTEDEKVILRNLPKEYKWIVREKDERLWCHTEIPTRSLEPCGWAYRSVNSLSVNIVAFNHLFQFITWEDEPYLIEDLLK